MRPISPEARPAGPLRLAWLHLRIGALNEMQSRANFWVHLVNSAIALTTGLIAISLVYTHTSSLGGWGRPQLLAVMGVHILIGGLVRAFVQPNVNKLMEDVQQGTLDYLLTRPADSQLLVSVREISLWSLVDVLVGAGVIAWAIVEAEPVLGWAEATAFLLALGCGAVILYCLWLSVTTLAFKVVRIDNLVQLLNGVYEAGRWPVTIYPGWLRSTLTFVVPLAFAVTVPAEIVTARLEWVALAGAGLMTLAALAVTRLIWRWGIRNYAGASA